MTDLTKTSAQQELDQQEFEKLLEKNPIPVLTFGEVIKGRVLNASRAEVKLDIDGHIIGVVRGPELYEEDDDYNNLQYDDIVEATVIDTENENGDVELSFRYAGQEKAWAGLRSAHENDHIVKVRVADANKGGLLVKYRQIAGFLPVSQLAPENYPRVSGGDKTKILDKLKSYMGRDFEVKIITLDEKDDKIIFSEKAAWNEQQKDVISKYKAGTVVDGEITAVTNFGVFVSFGENLEGLIHISELAWQRIDDPQELYKVGESIKAEVINIDGSKIFLSAKKLLADPWTGVEKKYKVGTVVNGKVLKINPFGLFVELDSEIHGLAHISQLNLAPKQKLTDLFKTGEERDFEVVSLEIKEHRLGLTVPGAKKEKVDVSDKKEKIKDNAEESTSDKK